MIEIKNDEDLKRYTLELIEILSKEKAIRDSIVKYKIQCKMEKFASSVEPLVDIIKSPNGNKYVLIPLEEMVVYNIGKLGNSAINGCSIYGYQVMDNGKLGKTYTQLDANKSYKIVDVYEQKVG